MSKELSRIRAAGEQAKRDEGERINREVEEGSRRAKEARSQRRASLGPAQQPASYGNPERIQRIRYLRAGGIACELTS